MPRHTLYAYATGQPSEDVARSLQRDLLSFIDSRAWLCPAVSVVNDPPAPPYDRQVGLNLELPDGGSEPDGWFGDVEAIANHLSRLAAKHDVEFAVGIGGREAGTAEDLFEITSAP